MLKLDIPNTDIIDTTQNRHSIQYQNNFGHVQYLTRNTRMQQSVAISSKANDLLSHPDLNLNCEMTQTSR